MIYTTTKTIKWIMQMPLFQCIYREDLVICNTMYIYNFKHIWGKNYCCNFKWFSGGIFACTFAIQIWLCYEFCATCLHRFLQVWPKATWKCLHLVICIVCMLKISECSFYARCCPCKFSKCYKTCIATLWNCRKCRTKYNECCTENGHT